MTSLAEPQRPWTVHIDGTALPNPGRMGIGALITTPEGARQEISLELASRGCNNEAEARALITALGQLAAMPGTSGARVQVYTDSTVLLEQLAHGARCILRLADLFAEARQALARFECVELTWIPRHRNSEADTLARNALGLPAKTKRRR